MDAALVPGWVMHQRFFPQQYRFRYPVISALFDIDRLAETTRRCRLFSLDRRNLFSLRTRDHGPRDGRPWRPWIETRLAEHGIELAGGRIRLLTMPRVLGHAFNPLSIWYAWHADGGLRAILLEVRNTFGEHHHYLLHENGAPMALPVRQQKDKSFHVSPFIDMHARYAFTLTPPRAEAGASLRIAINEYQDQELMLTATQHGRLRPFNDRALLGAFLRKPWMTLRVLPLIHWQALRIWWRGGRYHPRPPRPAQEID
ncbi:DUF1365 domain-containing protein [Thioalkalivibrio sp. ALJ16]|uniref:DUF1365 domain-containing protein n=1 Tax=Thioalkalivibrio sp. ALJ16 TaxID=1158762 RepID=UPI00037C1D7C|nr:DUF1365 domain-containing protein [Thioalkalivibrio sp. ALJ16]